MNNYGNPAESCVEEAPKEFIERKTYVCLEGLIHHNKFYTSTYDDPDHDYTKLQDGTTAYKVLGFANTPDEAQTILFGPEYHTSAQVRSEVMYDYLNRNNIMQVSDFDLRCLAISLSIRS